MSNNTQVLEVVTKVWTSRGELGAAEIFPRIIVLLVFDVGLVIERRRYNPHDHFERSPVRFPWWFDSPLVLVVDSGILDGGYKQG